MKLLLTLLAVALTACGGGQDEPRQTKVMICIKSRPCAEEGAKWAYPYIVQDHANWLVFSNDNDVDRVQDAVRNELNDDDIVVFYDE